MLLIIFGLASLILSFKIAVFFERQKVMASYQAKHDEDHHPDRLAQRSLINQTHENEKRDA